MVNKINRRLKIDDYEQNQFWKHYYGLRQELVKQPATQGDYVGRVFREISAVHGWKSRYEHKYILSFAKHIANYLDLKLMHYTANDNRTINWVFVG